MQGVFSIERYKINNKYTKEENRNGNSKYCRKLKSFIVPKGYQTDFVNGITTFEVGVLMLPLCHWEF